MPRMWRPRTQEARDLVGGLAAFLAAVAVVALSTAAVVIVAGGW